jgi:hypothetical protein
MLTLGRNIEGVLIFDNFSNIKPSPYQIQGQYTFQMKQLSKYTLLSDAIFDETAYLLTSHPYKI